MPSRDREHRVAAMRRFNRFYTRQIGVLRKTYLDSPYSLAELRVLYEIAHSDAPTASQIGRTLDLDAGYLSRVIRNFEKRGFVRRKASRRDARRSHLALSPRGQRMFAPLDARSQAFATAMLERLPPGDQARLIDAMATIQVLLAGSPEGAEGQTTKKDKNYILRAPRPGDYGRIVKRHAELYAIEYGWTEPFEGLCAEIVGAFANKAIDRKRERCWIAELDGETVGSVFVAEETAEVARLRLLLVDPKARGLGIGARLTDECVRFARAAGYKKITLWTHSVLTAARHIYQQAGFTLTRSEPRVSFGKPVVSEHWDLEL